MRLRAAVATLSLAALLAACGGSSATPTPKPATPAPSAVAGSPAAIAKVSANTATADELVAALTAAGVANPDRWAREIQEYRPYDASDTKLDKLRGELEKYNPGEETLNTILSVLQP
ncbi:MAG: hypothetical protein U0869_06320 [Chloroflexota bacterium]